jgi:toxin ParE1/3/4
MLNSYTVLWTRTALDDLKRIIRYIGMDSKNRAADIFKKIRSEAERLKEMPQQGRIVPELLFYKIETYRELIESPWRIIYRIEKTKVFIASVIDGRRNIEDILIDRFL